MNDIDDFMAPIIAQRQENDAWLAEQTRESLLENNAKLLESMYRRGFHAFSLYPATIKMARYGGTYEGGSWVSFPCYEWQVPSDSSGSDIPCSSWWGRNRHLVGIGNSPQEALADMIIKKRDNEDMSAFYMPWVELPPHRTEAWMYYNNDGTIRRWDELPNYVKRLVEMGVDEPPEEFVIPEDVEVGRDDDEG